MKRFNEWLNRMRPFQPFYAGLKGLRGMQFWEKDGLIHGHVQPAHEAEESCPKTIPLPAWLAFIRGLGRRENNDRMEAWAISGLMSDGVKAFCPTADEYAALARTDINVTWDDYRQPFETMVVVIPDGVITGVVSADIGTPVAAVVRCDSDARLCVTVLVGDGPCYITGRYPWRRDSGETIERHLRRLHGSMEGLNVTDGEESVSDQAKRVAINSCLMLTHLGAKRVGYANPEYAAKLESSLKKKRLPENIREANRTALKLVPDLYAFDQSVRLFDREGDGHGGGEGGYEVKPHWRRGHWARQVHGAGGALRKLVFRRPTLVNAHKFHGERFDTTATYTTSERTASA